jgi:hypothetical protein
MPAAGFNAARDASPHVKPEEYVLATVMFSAMRGIRLRLGMAAMRWKQKTLQASTARLFKWSCTSRETWRRDLTVYLYIGTFVLDGKTS